MGKTDVLHVLQSQTFEDSNNSHLPKFFFSKDWRNDTTQTAIVRMKGYSYMNILQSYLKSSDLSSSVITSIADSMLEYDNGMSLLPTWFTELYQLHDYGLFASSYKENSCANPTDLLQLYIKRGMYIQACNFVSDILLCQKEERKISAVQLCLPEKGHI